MMIPVCPRLLDMITDFVLLHFWARASEDLSAIEVILLLLLLDNDLQGVRKRLLNKRDLQHLRTLATDGNQWRNHSQKIMKAAQAKPTRS